MLSLTHPTIFGWSQNYWGGNVAMIGGALCIGSLFRFIKTRKTRDAVIFALGIVLLTNSRPFEGLLVCLPFAAVVIYWFTKRFREPAFIRAAFLKFVVLISFVLLLNFVWMGYYNWKVTGDALKMPYSLYTQQYDPVPLLLPFSVPNENISYRHSVMKAFYEGEIENHYLVLYKVITKATLPALALRRAINNTIEFLYATFFYMSERCCWEFMFSGQIKNTCFLRRLFSFVCCSKELLLTTRIIITRRLFRF
ncbi:MAG: hypothetical protein WKF71_05575 [Pyrinomonadaceae bacterium]